VSASATASRTEIGVVYVAAVVQGLALVTFPAASSIFTSPDGFGFDSTRYGALFLPQVLLAILASALAPRLARRWSLRRVLLAGLAGDIVSMVLLALSRLLIGMPEMAFGVLLFATGALGLGFGATVMALNTYAEAFFPTRADRAVLALNALLGLGTRWRRFWWRSWSRWARGGSFPWWWHALPCCCSVSPTRNRCGSAPAMPTPTGRPRSIGSICRAASGSMPPPYLSTGSWKP
jgi:MFS family permease